MKKNRDVKTKIYYGVWVLFIVTMIYMAGIPAVLTACVFWIIFKILKEFGIE